MGNTTTRSSFLAPRSGSGSDVQAPCYRYTFTAAPLVSANDTLEMFKIPRGARLIDGFVQWSDNDEGANGRVALIVTDGTTTYTIVAGADISAAGSARGGNGSGAHDWCGKVLGGTGTWKCYVKCTTTLSTAAAAGFYAAWVSFVADPTPDAIPS